MLGLPNCPSAPTVLASTLLSPQKLKNGHMHEASVSWRGGGGVGAGVWGGPLRHPLGVGSRPLSEGAASGCVKLR